MHIGLIDGPGHHGQLMALQLVAKGHTVTRAQSFPHFDVSLQRPGAPAISLAHPVHMRAHDVLRRVSAGAHHRLGRWLRRSYDFDFYTRVYDRFADAYLADCDAVIGFSFVTRHTHERALRRGQFTVLEAPTSHLAVHLELLEEEHRLAGLSNPNRSGLVFSRFALERSYAEYEQADLVNVLSSYARRTLLERGIPANRISVTPLGIDVDRFQPRAETDQGGGVFRVLCVGRVELHKGVRYLLEAFAQLRLPNSELRLVGQVRDDARPFLETHGRSVVVSGHLSPEQVVACYAQADVLVFPTISDGFGLVMLEAMASGLPVIATENSGGPDVIRQGQDGFVVPIRDSKALAERLEWFYHHPHERLSMGRSARARVSAEFRQEHYGARLQHNLAAAMSATRSPRRQPGPRSGDAEPLAKIGG